MPFFWLLQVTRESVSGYYKSYSEIKGSYDKIIIVIVQAMPEKYTSLLPLALLLTVVQSYTKKYEFVAVCIVTSLQHDNCILLHRRFEMHKTFEQKLQNWWHTSTCTEAQDSEKHHSWPETHFSSLEWFFFYIVSGLLFYRLPVCNTHHPPLCLLEWPTFRAKWCVFRGSNGMLMAKRIMCSVIEPTVVFLQKQWCEF